MSSKNKIQVHFVGESAEDVTGSIVWVKTPTLEFLIECGLYQGSGDLLEEYQINNAPFKFKPKNISYVFACHNHGDHILRIPLLAKRGFKGKVIMPSGSAPIARILMEDSARIMQGDAEELSKKYGRDYHPIYEQADVDNCLNMLEEFPMGEEIQLDENIKFKFVPSGHILNAAQIKIKITEGNVTKTIAYTSDLGNTHLNRNYISHFEPIRKGTIFIGETTYAGEDRIATQKIRDKDLEKLKGTILSTCTSGGNGRVLIPCFANARSQEMLTHLYNLFHDDPTFDVPIYFDTPMGIRICEAYRNLLSGEEKDLWESVMQWENVKFISDSQESLKIQRSEEPAVIIASSGMLTHGRSRAYAKELLRDARNVIVFCGYSVDNSLASIIKSGQVKAIKFGDRKIPNRCRIVDLHSFSSHMQKDSLLDYYSSVDCEKILLVHGDMDGKIAFSHELAERISKNDLTSKVICVNKGYYINL